MTVRCLGWDMSAAFALADALGVDRMAVALFLPEIEQVAMRQLNDQVANQEP
ncbi:DUF7697 family protein [Paracoccus litorisediminis]|uniref:DUF7697 family protein n=1 Tax=Paracoccus litorisediminis TaxID=2006130 RepID=UPI0014785709|nr:hypothetical protein [Paracoccus litorisediminis]